MLAPWSEAELADLIRGAEAPLVVQGGGTRPVGRPVDGTRLSTENITGISLYEPGALTLVARAGTPLAEIEETLAAENQVLAFEPPDLRAVLGTEGTPTIGGVVATNASGPRRIAASGACRDALLGVRFVDGTGTVAKNGGRVMKNVTGYDLVKLFCGSWGTLGVLTEVSLKVAPKLSSATIAIRGAEGADALSAMTDAVTSPFDISGAAYVPGEAVYLRIEGLEASITYRAGRLQSQLAGFGSVEITDDREASAAIWQRLRDVRDFADDSYALWRVSMRPSAMFDALIAGATELAPLDYRLDWSAGLAWLRLTEAEARTIANARVPGDSTAATGAAILHQKLQDITAAAGGHATLFKAPEALRRSVPSFQPEAPGIAALSQGLRAKFDPRNLLNPGLML
ncbi:MAG: FAD-binding protein [Pseudomonadota bacterium]